MTVDRITQLRVSNMRAVEQVTLDLSGLTVLIGDNGTGKSTLLDAFELFRQAAKPLNFVQDILVRAHGGLNDFVRHGATSLTLGVVVEGAGAKLDYELEVANVGAAPRVVGERLGAYRTPDASESSPVVERDANVANIFDFASGKLGEAKVEAGRLAVASLGLDVPEPVQRLLTALERIDHQVAYETRPLWQQRELDIRVGPRWPAVVEATSGVARHGVNLPNCFQQLRNLGSNAWARVIERARLGLGEDVRGFKLTPAGRGNIEIEVVFGALPDRPLPASALSEGQLAYLGFIALVELNLNRSVLVFDEPESHLHPALLSRVVWMLEEVAETCPVVLATHSDRLLDALAHPEESVLLCELDQKRATRLRKPNKARLAEWLESYRGLGSLRAEGYEPHVFDDGDDDDRARRGPA